MNKYIKIILIIFHILLAYGCTTILQYPSTSQDAVIYLENKANVRIYMDSYANSEDCSGGVYKLTGFDGVLVNEVKPIRLMPNKNQSFLFTRLGHTESGATKFCRIVVTFTPRPNEIYSFSFFENETKCMVRQTGGNSITDLQEKKFKVSKFSGNGPWCE